MRKLIVIALLLVTVRKKIKMHGVCIKNNLLYAFKHVYLRIFHILDWKKQLNKKWPHVTLIANGKTAAENYFNTISVRCAISRKRSWQE